MHAEDLVASFSAVKKRIMLEANIVTARIIQVVHRYNANSSDEERCTAAQATWLESRANDGGWNLVEHRLKPGDRSSADLGDKRPVPYIRDLINYASEIAADTDILMLANADIFLMPDAGQAVRAAMNAGDCCYSWRISYRQIPAQVTRTDLAKQKTDWGIDLIAVRRGWWLKHRDEYPDLFIGCGGWDSAMRLWFERHNQNPCIDPPIYYHKMHESFWKINKTNPAQSHNQKVYGEFRDRIKVDSVSGIKSV